MAIINKDMINRLSVENSIKIESMKNVRRNFAEGILNQLSIIRMTIIRSASIRKSSTKSIWSDL